MKVLHTYEEKLVIKSKMLVLLLLLLFVVTSSSSLVMSVTATSTFGCVGSGFTCVIDQNTSRVSCAGQASSGQLGTTPPANGIVSSPVMIGDVSVETVSCGMAHVCVVVVDEDDDDIRKVSCWGSAGSGELGISATEFPMTYSTIPQIVPSISNAAGVAAGMFFSLAWTTDGDVYGWGSNSFGVLNGAKGTQMYGTNYPPSLFSSLKNVVSIKAGQIHACYLTDTGVLYCGGFNNFGQIPDIDSFGDSTSPVLIKTGFTVRDFCVGFWHTCVVSDVDGTVWCSGASNAYQAGDPEKNVRMNLVQIPFFVANGEKSAKSIECGGQFTLVTTRSGITYAFGDNSNNEFGTTISSSSSSSSSLKKNGIDTTTILTPIVLAPSHDGGIFSTLVAGSVNTLFTTPKTDDVVWVTGSDSTGQWGDGTCCAGSSKAPVKTKFS